MSDIADLGAEREQEMREDALRDHRRRTGASVEESAESCAECGEGIPAARRALVPGVQTCVSCQQGREDAQRRAGGRHAPGASRRREL